MNAKNPDPHTPQLPQLDSSDDQATSWAIVWISLLTVLLRVFTLTQPLIGYFSIKNCVSAMIARNWALGRTDFLHPMLDCIRGGERSLHMVDLPCSTYLTGMAWRWFGGSLDVWGRSFSIFWTLGAVVMLYYYVRRHHGPTAAAGAAFALAVSPVSVIFGQHFMIEPSMMFLMIGTFFALDTGLRSGRWRWIIFSAIALALLLLTKIYMLILLLPIGLMLLATFFKTSKSKLFLGILLFGLASLPAIAWYAYAYHVGTEGHPLAGQMYYSIAQSTESHRLPHPLWVSPQFYLHTFDVLAMGVITPLGFLVFWFGLIAQGGRRHFAWLAVSFLLIWLLPRKFYEMNYYYLALLPPVCIMVGLGWSWLARGMQLSRRAILFVIVLALLVSMRYTVGPLFVIADEDRPVIVAAESVKQHTDPDDRVIAIHATGIDLLYYCDRAGWTGQMRPDDWSTWVRSCRDDGAKYLVVVETTSMPTPSVAEFPPVQTPPIDEGPGWKLFRLEKEASADE